MCPPTQHFAIIYIYSVICIVTCQYETFLHHYELVNVVTLFIGYHASTRQIRLLNAKRSSTLFEAG